jgi:hypothetical protein
LHPIRSPENPAVLPMIISNCHFFKMHVLQEVATKICSKHVIPIRNAEKSFFTVSR